MKKIFYMVIALIFIPAFLVGCGKNAGNVTSKPANKVPQNLANPASVNCEQKGNKLVIRTNSDGSQIGICVFPDGSECDEWAYFRGQCSTKKAGSSDFAKCVSEGNQVIPSHPRRCRDKDGKMYTETNPNLTNQQNPSSDQCPDTYKPVCAKIQIECVKAPCNPVFETMNNECLAKLRGNLLLGYTDGTCESELTTSCQQDNDCKLPQEFAIRNSCPFKVSCLDKQCVVVCPSANASLPTVKPANPAIPAKPVK